MRPEKAAPARRRVREPWTPARFTVALSTAAREAERVALTSDDAAEVLRAGHALAALCGAHARLRERDAAALTAADAAALTDALRVVVGEELRRLRAGPESFERIADGLAVALADALPAALA